MENKVEMISNDALIPIQIGALFLQDLQSVLVFLGALQPVERLQEMSKKLNEGKDEELDDWEKSVQVMVTLISAIEETAKQSGLTTLVDIPAEEKSPESPE